MNLEEMKKKYEDYICLYKNIGNAPYGWNIVTFDGKHSEMYKFIHKKDKNILDAYLADNSVIIEFAYPGYTFCIDLLQDFIETYNEDLDYRLKESGAIPEWDSSTTYTEPTEVMYQGEKCIAYGTNSIPEVDKPKNNFEEYGFTADFEGEIFIEADGRYFGIVKTKAGFVNTYAWLKDGKCLFGGELYPTFNLTPIKKEWYEDEDILKKGVPIIDNSDRKILDVAYSYKDGVFLNSARCEICNILDIQNNECRVITKEELLSLYYEES